MTTNIKILTMKTIRAKVLKYFRNKYEYSNGKVYGDKQKTIFTRVEFRLLWKFLDLTK